VSPLFTNMAKEECAKKLQGIAEENDFAERCGFTCELDDARGFGLCKFKQAAVGVWKCGWNWGRADLINGRYQNHYYFRTLGQALQNDAPYAKRGPYGSIIYLGGADDKE